MTDAMVIDTNVLEHVFDPAMNVGGHIETLLKKFSAQGKKLCIDRPVGSRKSRIIQEYQHRLQARIDAMDQQNQLYEWLRYVIVLAERLDTPVNLADGLGSCFVPRMNRVNAERSDQVFVYVACALDSVMVSNNNRHITGIKNHLCRCARAAGSDNTDFLSSTQAEAEM
jgi:hypothetical protein